MMKFSILLIMFSFLLSAGYAQQDIHDLIDIIYLKDGGVVRGVILEKKEGDFVQIQTGKKAIQLIKYSEIEKIEKEEMDEHAVTFSLANYQKTGYALQIDLGFQRDNKFEQLNRLQVDIVNGFRLNPWFSLGLGLGLRYYTGARDLLIPVYGNLRLKLLNRKLSPFFSLSYGYSFDSSNGADGIMFTGMGSIFRPSAGISLQTFRKSFICAGIQLEQQQFRQANSADNYFYSTAGTSSDFSSRALGIFVGYGF